MENNIAWLCAKYEANGNPGTISGGNGDLGGASYGAFQFNSRDNIVADFIDWVIDNVEEPLRNYAVVLRDCGICTDAFDDKWREIASIDPDGFFEIQSKYAIALYFEPANNLLVANGITDVTKRTKTLQAVLMSRAIQYSAHWMPDLFQHGFQFAIDNYDDMGEATCVGDCGDYRLISGIYDYLYEDACNAYQLPSGYYHSPDDWSNGSYDVIGGLKNRFIAEKLDAFAALEKEYKEKKGE